MTIERITTLAVTGIGAACMVYLGFQQLHLGRHVDRLESEGKLSPDAAQRIRTKPMKKIGRGLILSGIALFILLNFVRPS